MTAKTAEKANEPEVEFSHTKKSEATLKWSRKTKITVFGSLTIVFFLGVVVSVATFLAVRKTTPARLAEVNLAEGDSVTYRVDQDIEIQGGDEQKSTIRALVGMRVLNKTSEEYWFLMKINLSFVVRDVKTQAIREYYMVRLPRSKTTHGCNGTEESFELYGNMKTPPEFIGFVHGTLDQLLPTMKRDLYEDVDGEKSSRLKPEKTPRVPGAVNMHREANTSDEGTVFIKNHFDDSDLVNFSSAVDMNLMYRDISSVNKSSGMVTESRAYLSEQLNFGQPVRTKSGLDVEGIKITVVTHISLIDTHSFFLTRDDNEAISMHSFVRLECTDQFKARDLNVPSSSDNMSPNGSVYNHRNLTQTSKAINGSLTRNKRSISETFEKKIALFCKKVLGITISGEAKISLEATVGKTFEIGLELFLKFGDFVVEVLHRTYAWEAGKKSEKKIEESWNKEITRATLVYGIILGVEFNLKFNILIEFNFPSISNVKNPGTPIQAIEIKPLAEVVTTITGFVEVFPVRAGARGRGTIVKAELPLSLKFEGVLQDKDSTLDGICMELTPRLTALKLTASTVYSRWVCPWWCSLCWWLCEWGDWEVYHFFGEWQAIETNYDTQTVCF